MIRCQIQKSLLHIHTVFPHFSPSLVAFVTIVIDPSLENKRLIYLYEKKDQQHRRFATHAITVSRISHFMEYLNGSEEESKLADETFGVFDIACEYLCGGTAMLFPTINLFKVMFCGGDGRGKSGNALVRAIFNSSCEGLC